MKEYVWSETYILTKELEDIQELLSAAVIHGENNGFLIPYSYWIDKKGWLYIKWNEKASNMKSVVRYKFNKGDLIAEAIKINLKAEERLRGKDTYNPVVLITGDTHRNFKRIIQFCEKYPTTKEDVLIILGDAGINYCNDIRDTYVKERLAQLPITLFCIHGNHEMRPETIDSYKSIIWKGGQAYVENKYPNLIFAKDGEIYTLADKKVLVIGGAYSVDKWYRLQQGYGWFEDEQPSEEIKNYVEKQLEISDWAVDVVLSHTTPYQCRPVDLFLDFVDQSTVDSSTEKWLMSLEEKLSYDKWYAGHYHCDRTIDKLQIMYRNVELFCGNRDLKFSME